MFKMAVFDNMSIAFCIHRKDFNCNIRNDSYYYLYGLETGSIRKVRGNKLAGESLLNFIEIEALLGIGYLRSGHILQIPNEVVLGLINNLAFAWYGGLGCIDYSTMLGVAYLEGLSLSTGMVYNTFPCSYADFLRRLSFAVSDMR